jgi:hypothetical protein
MKKTIQISVLCFCVLLLLTFHSNVYYYASCVHSSHNLCNAFFFTFCMLWIWFSKLAALLHHRSLSLFALQLYDLRHDFYYDFHYHFLVYFPPPLPPPTKRRAHNAQNISTIINAMTKRMAWGRKYRCCKFGVADPHILFPRCVYDFDVYIINRI